DRTGQGRLGLLASAEGPAFSWFCHRSILSVATLPPLPERTERAVLTVRKVLALLVRAAHVPLGHRHLLDAVLKKEVLQLQLHFGVGHHVRGHPPLEDRL